MNTNTKTSSRAPALTVEFNTNQYRGNHGAEPRGRGSWAFHLPDGELYWTRSETSAVMTYSDAKRACVAELRRRGVTGSVRVDVAT